MFQMAYVIALYFDWTDAMQVWQVFFLRFTFSIGHSSNVNVRRKWSTINLNDKTPTKK